MKILLVYQNKKSNAIEKTYDDQAEQNAISGICFFDAGRMVFWPGYGCAQATGFTRLAC